MSTPSARSMSPARRAGPVGASAPDARLRPLPFDGVVLSPTGRLGAWQTVNAGATVPHCIAKVHESGAVENFARLVAKTGAPHRGLAFADSDVHKTIEAAAWAAASTPLGAEADFVRSTANLLARVQEPDGYLNSWVQDADNGRRWADLPDGHELYCAGHLIQAGVAVKRALGEDTLLQVARRFADLLQREFGQGGRDAVCGHPEIEMALVELFRETDHEPYLALARRFIDLRGHGLLGVGKARARFYQDHAPVREATEATGHAVRQLYLACGATDVYLETGDALLLRAMEQLWDDVYDRRAYITGGLGSRHRDESFGDAYELPSDRAYAETCAAIAAFMWNWRLLLATGRARYADAMEVTLYNAIAAGVSEDGTSFSYANPLQLRPGHQGTAEESQSERREWYACACCPPNIARLIASIHHYLTTSDADGLQIHLPSRMTVSAAGHEWTLALAVETDYPSAGSIRLRVLNGEGVATLAVRLPSWAVDVTVLVNGEITDATTDNGYLRLRRPWATGSTIDLRLQMPVRLMRAHPHVDALRWCGAVMRGPLVYCIESIGVPNGRVDDLRLDPSRLPVPIEGGHPARPPVLRGSARLAPATRVPLYEAVGDQAPAERLEEAEFSATPYADWGNRGSAAMRVWLPLDLPRPTASSPVRRHLRPRITPWRLSR